MVLGLQDMGFLGGVPNAHFTVGITRSDVETGRSITSDSGLRNVLLVQLSLADILNWNEMMQIGRLTNLSVSNHNGVTDAIQNIDALGVTTNVDGLTTSHRGDGGIDFSYEVRESKSPTKNRGGATMLARGTYQEWQN